MFKIFKHISKSFGGGRKPAESKPAAKTGGPLGKVTRAAPPKTSQPQSPEELCGITPKMSSEEIRARLKMLFRRYNRSASSLDATLRGEADKMLDAIVQVREKHFGEI